MESTFFNVAHQAVRLEVPSRYNDFQAWAQNTKLAGMTPKARSWYEANRDSVVSKQQKYWRVWQRKSHADLQLRTLHSQDGL